MKKVILIVSLGLLILMTNGCITSYTMTTRNGQVIDTLGMPVADASTGFTKYADLYGYQRTIKTGEIINVMDGPELRLWEID